jgi:hypothetical protein
MSLPPKFRDLAPPLQYPNIVPGVHSIWNSCYFAVDRNISNIYMKIETSHAFYNLVNCMSPYFYAYT